MTRSTSSAKTAAPKAPRRAHTSEKFRLVLRDELGSSATPTDIELPDDEAKALIKAIQKMGYFYAPKSSAFSKIAGFLPGKVDATIVVRERSSTSVKPDAFALNARAQAVLLGREYAEADLKEGGGAYDVEQVRRLLNGVSRQAIDKRVQEGALLTVPGPSNKRRFPALQFRDDGSVVDGLREVRAALRFTSPWSVLNFLINPQTGLGGAKPIDLLRRGEVARVVDAAERIGVQGA